MIEKSGERHPPIHNITGVILAGGQSSRFGSNKALAIVDGKPLIQLAADTIISLFASCLLVTNTPATYRFLDIPMIGDVYLGLGPLAGIHAALEHIKSDWIFVVGCDMPRLNAELIKRLCSLAAPGQDAVIPWLASGPEPLYGLYHKNSLPIVEKHLKNGKAAIHEALEELSVRRVSEAEIIAVSGDLSTFDNINLVRDLPHSGQ